MNGMNSTKTLTGTVLKMTVVTLLTLAFATPVFAADDPDFRSSMRKFVEESAKDAAPQASAKNPYKPAAFALMAAGVGIAVYGFTHTTGAKVDVNLTESGGASSTVKETKATGIGLAGVGLAAAGGVVYMLGEKKAQSMQPQVAFGPNYARVGGTVRW